MSIQQFFYRRPQFRFLACLLSVACLATSSVFSQDEEYPVPEEATRRDGVPEGEVVGPFELKSEVYPGTVRNYWVYVPAQYDAEKPACTLIVQDGLNRAKGWRLPTVCDNLIHTKEMPVTVGIFIDPGVVPVAQAEAQPRFNRSLEYDALGDRYARFLLSEVLPEVGKSYNLSDDPNDRALAGASSGGICAFNAAWERPDAFRRVISTIGTYVGLRGANQLSALVRKVEPKPIRVFLQDGSSDLNIYAGDWWTANQDMLSALEWAGYDVHHVWGEGGHNGKHSAAIMPEALKWIWREYPEPIQAAPNASGNRRVDLLPEGAEWTEISSGHEFAESPASNAGGELFFSDSQAGRIYRLGEDGKTRIFANQTGSIRSLSFSPDGQLYAIKDGNQIVRFGTDGKSTTVLEGVQASALVTLPKGFYFYDAKVSAIVWSDYQNAQGTTGVALPVDRAVSSICPTSDHAFLHLLGSGQSVDHVLRGDGEKLLHRQSYGYLEMPYMSGNSRATGTCIDQESRLFVASPIGIQVLDQLGRVNFIIKPPSREPLTGISFAGGAKDQLFVTTPKSVYRRQIKTRGATSFGPAIKPPKPRL
ncbi:MAG: alpha/beta hydrolase-fold protein [Pirellulaceae bacterium]